ncbi:unnamed protein product [Closterium sp. NIES-64]|nr:unnamed protein product [Closterium sp. NIES-64]
MDVGRHSKRRSGSVCLLAIPSSLMPTRAPSGGLLPGSHCSVIAILYPGDLLKAEGQVCRTSNRHIDPHTGKSKHRDEAVRMLKLFRTAVLAELGRPGRQWDGAPPSQAVVEDRLADCDHPIRDKVPDTVSDEKVGTGMLAATSFGWVAKQIDLLTGEKGRGAVRLENIKTKGLKSLRDSMVEYICKRIAEKRTAAPTSQPADSVIDDDGAERETAPQAAVAAQHQGNAKVFAEGGNGGGGGNAATGGGRKEEEESEEDSESESESEEEAKKRKDEEEDEEEEEKDEKDDGDEEEEGKDEEGKGKDGEGEGKDEEGEGKDGEGDGKDEEGVEEVVEYEVEFEEEEAALEAVSVDADEAANTTGVQETGDASGRQRNELDDVEQVRWENWLLRAENAQLATLLDAEQARLDRFFVGIRGLVDHVKELAEQVDDTEKYVAEQLRNATATMSKTITSNITGNFDEAWKTMKTFAEQATAWLEDFDNPQGRVAVALAVAVDALAEHVTGVVGEAQRGLELYITTQLSATQVNIATAVTTRLPVQPPPPPPPTPPALPEELLKSFKGDIMKAVTEATQQSFVASGMKMMAEMVGTVAPGRRGSSPSANDADHAQRKTADKQGLKRTGDGDDKESVNGDAKQSKGSNGSRGSKPAPQSVVDQLKTKAGWRVIRTSNTKGGGSRTVEGGPADGAAANVTAQPGPPLVAKKTHPQANSGKVVTDKEVPTAQAAEDGGAGTTKGPSVAVAAKGKTKAASATVVGTTKCPPRNPTTATRAPAGQSNGEARAAPPAPGAPAAVKGGAKAASAKGAAPASAKGPPGADTLREMLHRMEAHSRDVQQHPVVDAGLARTARRSVTPQVAGTSSEAPPAAHPVAAPTPADSKSAFLRAHLVGRKATAPPVTQQEHGKSATTTSVNATAPSPRAAVVDAEAERGVSAALATGGRADKHAALATFLAHFDAAERLEHAPALAIMDTAHVGPSATHGGGSAEPTAAMGAVAESNAGGKGKVDTGKGSAVSQRSTRAMSAGKEMSEEKGKKTEGSQDRKGGKSKPTKKKEKAEEDDEEGGEGDKERRGHGIRQDRSGDGHGWVGEIKVNGRNRYIGKSREKMELAYEHAIAYVVYDGYVSKVLMKELTVFKLGELEKWKEVWEEVKFLPTGLWTVMWARGLCHSRARIDDILGRYRGYARSGDALHGVLWPAIWFPIIENTEEGKEETEALMSAMVNRVSMCAAYGKVAASAAFGKVDASVEGNAGEKTEMEGAEGKADEKTEMAAQALAASACALWCFVETGASLLGAVGKGKAAAMVAGAEGERAEAFKKVMHAVIDLACSREAPAGEVAHKVAPSLQRHAVVRAFEEGVEEVEADMIARATVETLAFWGMCPVAGPKLKEQGINVPCDAKMEYDMDHMGRKGEKVKQGKGSKRKKGKEGKGSTDA